MFIILIKMLFLDIIKSIIKIAIFLIMIKDIIIAAIY